MSGFSAGVTPMARPNMTMVSAREISAVALLLAPSPCMMPAAVHLRMASAYHSSPFRSA